MDIFQDDAQKCQAIINYLCSKPSLPLYSNTVNGNLFYDVEESDCLKWFTILHEHFGDYISYNANGGRIYIINNGKTCVKSPDGILKWYEQWKEDKELKTVEDANLWYNTENARIIYENHEKIWKD